VVNAVDEIAYDFRDLSAVMVVVCSPVGATQPAELLTTPRAGHVWTAAVLLDRIITRRTSLHVNEHRLRRQSPFVVTWTRATEWNETKMNTVCPTLTLNEQWPAARQPGWMARSSHSFFTCHLHVYPRMEWAILRFCKHSPDGVARARWRTSGSAY